MVLLFWSTTLTHNHDIVRHFNQFVCQINNYNNMATLFSSLPRPPGSGLSIRQNNSSCRYWYSNSYRHNATMVCNSNIVRFRMILRRWLSEITRNSWFAGSKGSLSSGVSTRISLSSVGKSPKVSLNRESNLRRHPYKEINDWLDNQRR